MSRHRRSQPDGYDENRAAAFPGAASSLGHLFSPGLPPGEWDVLIHLPAQVVIAAISAETATGGPTVVEGLAGIEAIAGGRAFDSDLVRAVVAAIFAEPDATEGGPGATGAVVHEFADRSRDIADVLATCRSVTAILAARADPADSASYRQWLQSIAAKVCEVARSGSAGAGGARFSDAGRRFLGDLGAALSLS
jgi:hypothetical protein